MELPIQAMPVLRRFQKTQVLSKTGGINPSQYDVEEDFDAEFEEDFEEDFDADFDADVDEVF